MEKSIVMKKNGFNLMSWFFVLIVGMLATACNDDEAISGNGQVDFEITDAPSDDEGIESVMVTVAAVKVDGKTLDGFQRQTIDLKAYSEGRTKLLLSRELSAKAYKSITLVLDLDKDADGNAPGCYVLTEDQTKSKLATSADGFLNIDVKKNWSVRANSRSRIIIDFDLRKSIRYSASQSERYTFVTGAALQSAVRIVAAEASGTIKGAFDHDQDADMIVVYAYKKGSFNAAVEEKPNSAGITFANAVASAEVKASLTGDSYTLTFLEEGDYELHFVAYNRNNETGRVESSLMLNAETEVNGNAANLVTVEAGVLLNVRSRIKI